jgi:putative nucleotidyltransferase with HDIG domain
MAESLSLMENIKVLSASDQMKLPVFPAVALELQSLISKRNFTLNEFATIVSKDQALASQVLKLANSAFYSGFRKVHTIKDAVMRFGTNQTLNCVITMGQRDCYVSNNVLINDYMGTLWQHALVCALGTKWVLEKIGCQSLAEEGFLAGLLHDIGKLVLLKVVEKLIDRKEADFSQTFILELLESMHAQEGGELLERYSVPEVYCRIARDHHKDDFDPNDSILLTVRVVNQACRKLGIGMHQDQSLLLPLLPEVPHLGMREIVLAELEVLLEDALSVESALSASA